MACVALTSAAATGAGTTIAGSGRQLFVRDDGHVLIVESVDEVSSHVRRQVVDRRKGVVEIEIQRIECRRVLGVGLIEFVVAATQFRDVRVAGVLCPRNIFEPVDAVMPPVVSQFVVCSLPC